MAHYAYLDENNIVVDVIVGIDETETIDGFDPETWYGNLRNLTCKRTSYNNNYRKNYAGIGSTYDPVRDEFVKPQPFPLWSLDENNDWQPPTPKPNDNCIWSVDESSWVEVPAG